MFSESVEMEFPISVAIGRLTGRKIDGMRRNWLSYRKLPVKSNELARVPGHDSSLVLSCSLGASRL